MGNRKTLPYEKFKSGMRDHGPKETRCVRVQSTILYFLRLQIFLKCARQNPYFPGYADRNLKFKSWAIEKRYCIQSLSAE